MKNKHIVYIIVLFVPFHALNAEVFKLTFSKTLLNKAQFGAAIISDQFGGEILTILKNEEESLKRDTTITLDIEPSQEISVTVIMNRGYFDAVTYTKVISGSIIFDSSFYRPYDEFQKTKIKIKNVSSYGQIFTYSPNGNRTIRTNIEDETLLFSYTSYTTDGKLIYFFLNEDNRERCFYSTTEDTEYELNSLELLSDFEIQQINFFQEGDWELTLIGIEELSEKKVYLYKDYKKNVGQIDLLIPEEVNFNKYQIHIVGGNFEYYDELESLPYLYDGFNLDIISEYADGVGFKFHTEGEAINCYEVEYLFTSTSGMQGYSIASKWRIIGLTQGEIEYILPEIPEEVKVKIPSMEFVNSPISVRKKAGTIHLDDLEEFWLEPHQFFRFNWRLENGVHMKSKYFYLGQ